MQKGERMAMSARRPLPALAFLLALSLLTALVWWRVFNRTQDDGDSAGARPTCAAQQNVNLPAPNTVHVTVLNATDRAGLAGTVSAALAADGFVMGTPDNDTGSVPGVAEIRFGSAGTAAANLLLYYLPGASLVPTPTATDATVVVSVGANVAESGGVQTVDQANASIAAANNSPAPDGTAKPC
jgi:hypothetical protein